MSHYRDNQDEKQKKVWDRNKKIRKNKMTLYTIHVILTEKTNKKQTEKTTIPNRRQPPSYSNPGKFYPPIGRELVNHCFQKASGFGLTQPLCQM